jgi:predicted DNA-binding protein with PD1-like motif
MIRSNPYRRLFVLAAGTALLLPLAAPVASQPAAAPSAAEQKPLPDGYTRQPAVRPGLAPKMTYEEKTATAHVFEVRFAAGDEIVSGLNDLVAKHGITAGHITGIGGLAPGALLGWGDPDVGGFKKIEIRDKTEIVSLTGDIALRNGMPFVHVHMIVGSADGSTKAGHLLEAHVAPLAEITVVATSLAAR